uniref:DNA replication factor Dna2 domain containing protein n=1 Tax=Haemonchus contortus TaxID=6289 RepID=W6NC95_HAECO
MDEAKHVDTSSAEEHVNDSGVQGFPSLNNPDSEVLLTVREVKYEEGLVDLVCVTEDGKESIVYLQDWLVSNEHGIMIVAPDTLVPCTSIAGATWCPRKVILSDRFRGPTEANKAMLIGIIVHELFQVIVDWVQHNMPQGKSHKSTTANSITNVHDIEENIWVPQLGLKGKIDATLEVMLYSLMLSSRYKQPIGEGSLLYLKDGITRHVQPRALEMKGIINQRNHLASYLSKLRPDLLPVPKDDPKFCEKCDHALVCSFYQVSVEQASKSSQQMINFAKSKTSHLSADHISKFWIRRLWVQRNVTIVESVFAPGNMCTISTSTQPGILLAPIIESSSKFVTIRSDRLISRKDTYHLDLYHSFSTYPTTLGNLILLMANTETSARLRELIIDLAPPSNPCSDGSTLPASVQHLLSEITTSDGLSAEQRNAVQAAILCNDYTLIEGFPGSGKTTTIVALLRCLLQMNRTVLLTTNTHSALDNVLVKLKKYTSSSRILRLGNSSSVRVDVADLSLESKLSCCDGDKYKAAREILKETPLVASTCHYVPRDVLFSWRTFDYCIIDEASMVLEPVVISAIVAASRFVLVGDAHQLSPLVQSRKCSLVFESIIELTMIFHKYLSVETAQN